MISLVSFLTMCEYSTQKTDISKTAWINPRKGLKKEETKLMQDKTRFNLHKTK